MAIRRIYADKTELVLLVTVGKSIRNFNLKYDQIMRIQFDKCNERKFLFKVPSEKIQIVSNKHGEPFTFYRGKEGKFFDEYKRELERFAAENRITFADNTKEQQ